MLQLIGWAWLVLKIWGTHTTVSTISSKANVPSGVAGAIFCVEGFRILDYLANWPWTFNRSLMFGLDHLWDLHVVGVVTVFNLDPFKIFWNVVYSETSVSWIDKELNYLFSPISFRLFLPIKWIKIKYSNNSAIKSILKCTQKERFIWNFNKKEFGSQILLSERNWF